MTVMSILILNTFHLFVCNYVAGWKFYVDKVERFCIIIGVGLLLALWNDIYVTLEYKHKMLT